MRKPFRKEETFKKKIKVITFFCYARYDNTCIFFSSSYKFPMENKMLLLHFKLCAITVTMPFIPDSTSKNCQL